MLIKLFLVAFPVFLIIDMVWLGYIAKDLYKRELGPITRKYVNWLAAITFYIIFVAGLVLFVIYPSVMSGSQSVAILLGALFGLVTYATYDLTNLATLKGWSFKISVIDIVWGALLASLVSVITYFIAIDVLLLVA